VGQEHGECAGGSLGCLWCWGMMVMMMMMMMMMTTTRITTIRLCVWLACTRRSLMAFLPRISNVSLSASRSSHSCLL
jgi:hypothetical protein